jgi:hypothetical protein
MVRATAIAAEPIASFRAGNVRGNEVSFNEGISNSPCIP